MFCVKLLYVTHLYEKENVHERFTHENSRMRNIPQLQFQFLGF